jgi:hypothetical protein
VDERFKAGRQKGHRRSLRASKNFGRLAAFGMTKVKIQLAMQGYSLLDGGAHASR